MHLSCTLFQNRFTEELTDDVVPVLRLRTVTDDFDTGRIHPLGGLFFATWPRGSRIPTHDREA